MQPPEPFSDQRQVPKTSFFEFLEAVSRWSSGAGARDPNGLTKARLLSCMPHA
jgi:hypothetical protein